MASRAVARLRRRQCFACRRHELHDCTDRAEKVAKLAESIGQAGACLGEQEGRLLVIGSAAGPREPLGQDDAVDNKAANSVGAVHLRHLNPFPRNLGEIMERFDKILVPEMNMGQLAMLLKARYQRPVISMPKVHGRPFKISELDNKIDEIFWASPNRTVPDRTARRIL